LLCWWSDRVDGISRGCTKGPDIFCLTPVSQVFDLLGCDGAPHERRRPVGLAVLCTEFFSTLILEMKSERALLWRQARPCVANRLAGGSQRRPQGRCVRQNKREDDYQQ